MDKVHYGALKPFLAAFDINPKVFQNLCEDKVEGWFPDLPERKSKVNIADLVDVLFNNEEPNAAKTLRAFARMLVRWYKDEDGELNDSQEVKDTYVRIVAELREWANDLEEQNV